MLTGKFLQNDFKCALINVYGPNEDGERVLLLNNLKNHIGGLNIPVILGGDFNVVRSMDERIGANLNRGAMDCFSEFIDDLSLLDLPLNGGWFTWSNFRERPSFSRLDRPFEIKKAIESHFKEIYNSSNTIPIKGFDCEMKKLNSDEAARLEMPFTKEEIQFALGTIESSKAPGPYRFDMGFLKKFWPSLKDEILDFFCKFYKGEVVDFSFNHSFIVLIPKIHNPNTIEDVRPISLVSSVYKLLAKVLAIRLGRVLEGIIGDQQFSFCLGKQILDCSLIANEVIDFTMRKGLEGVIFKADFCKAYDTIDWGFLLVISKKLGFGSVWCQWISTCLSTSYILVLVNGSPTHSFAIGRGLRQGYPLSPMLFNIVAEALSALLRKTTSCGFFSGFHIGQNKIEVSHIQFADDLILFFGAAETQIKNVVRILKGFELAAGLKLNLHKSKLFGVNVDDLKIESCAALLHCKSEKFSCQYLGLPLGATRNSVQLWSSIVEKFRRKLTGWKSRLLSFGGRITLIKSMLASLPVYFMSLFPMPVAVNSIITSLVVKFLWGSVDNKTICWIRWETLCLSKSRGGLGLVNFKVKNRALLNKWLWRFGSETDSLWRKVVNARYEEKNGSLLPANLKMANKSWIWRNIIAPLPEDDNLFKLNIRLTVGNGKYIAGHPVLRGYWSQRRFLKDLVNWSNNAAYED
ncbi:hypothetical protein GQ457_15G024410 [Hibiscus cannabinus]